MTDETNEVKTEPVAPPAAEPAKNEGAKPKKEPKLKKLKRKDLIIQLYNAGMTDPAEIAKKIQEAVAVGVLVSRENLRKAPASPSMWLAQAKWYLHQLKKAGIIIGEVKIRGPRKPKAEKKAEEPATKPTSPPVTEEPVGVL